MVTVTRLVLVAALWLVSAQGGLGFRVDDKKGFNRCRGKQLAKLERVEVSPCASWPCSAQVGRSGTYQVTFTPDPQLGNEVIQGAKSDIFAWVKLPLGGSRRPIRVPMPGEVKQSVCNFMSPSCPLQPGVPTTLSKAITIPRQARAVSGSIIHVEMRITDDRGRLLTCFIAPVKVDQ